jgi:23S rRNA (guanosine2251-2'-O)-methyltransferase
MQKLSLDELNRIDVEEFKGAKKLPVCIVLDNIRSLHNVGAAFRTGDAFRIEKIWLCGITGTPPHREIHKAALGATESVDWEHRPQIVPLVSELKKAGYTILAAEQTDKSISLDAYVPGDESKIALIFGNEVNGISDELLPLLDDCLEIPQFGTKHSLNVSVSIGIVVWELFKKLKVKLN